MFEHRKQKLIARREFVARLFRNALASLLLVVITLFIGMAGYHWLEDLAWVDAFVNASMILGGMGPVDKLTTSAGKIFAGCYALFAGIVFLIGVGVAFAPVIHRALHRFHLADDDTTTGA